MFERSNAYSNILFVRSVVSFVLQIAFAKWRNSRAKINVLRAQLGREMAIELKKKVVRQQTKSTLANGCFMNNSSS